MNQSWVTDNSAVNSFLGYQYLPEPTYDFDEGILQAANSPTVDGSKSELVEHGQNALLETFDKLLIQHQPDTPHVVPLSGGYDSRTILGALLKSVDPEQIHAFTYGTPGTLDFDLGRRVAKDTNVNHEVIDLRPQTLAPTEELVKDWASMYPRPHKIFGSLGGTLLAVNELDLEEYVFWSGYMGGEVAGAHLPDTPSDTFDEAVESFLSYNLLQPNLMQDEYDPTSRLPDSPTVDDDILSFDEQLDYGVRQPYSIKPGLFVGETVETPYLEDPWLSFILNVPRRWRKNEDLFKSIVTKTFPDLYSLPTDHNQGIPEKWPAKVPKYVSMWRTGQNLIRKRVIGHGQPDVTTNFIDWDVEIRRSENFRTLIRKQLRDLDARQSVDWIDCQEILEEHLAGNDRGSEITHLVSFEIQCKLYDGSQ